MNKQLYMTTLNGQLEHKEELIKYTRKSLLKNKHIKELKELKSLKNKYPEGNYLLSGLIIADALKSIHERIVNN